MFDVFNLKITYLRQLSTCAALKKINEDLCSIALHRSSVNNTGGAVVK